MLSTPNGARLDRALGQLDFMVSIDFYLNETTRHAHLILPPTFALERSHYDLVFHALAVRNTVKWSPPLFEKPAGAKDDWEILLELSTRIEAARRAPVRRGGEAEGAAGPRSATRSWASCSASGLTGTLMPFGAGLTFGRVKSAAHGIDLGPLRPALPERLAPATGGSRWRRPASSPTSSASRPGAGDGGRERPRSLIGRRDLRSNNSWMHNAERLVKGRDRCTLLMHPEDAAARGLGMGRTCA